MQAASPMLSISSSFSSFTCNDLAKTADRVVKEFRDGSIDPDQDYFFSFYEQNSQKEIDFHDESDDQSKKETNGPAEDSTEKKLNCDEIKEEKEEKDKSEVNEDEEFEFPSILSHSCSSPALADEIFCNGQIRPMYSFSFNNLQVAGGGTLPPVKPARRQPLRLLFLEESDSPSSSSSSEADDLDGLPPESYCIVGPKTTAAAAKEDGRCKKNKSTKSRWRLMNFLNRSSSEGGKGRSVFPNSDEHHPQGKKRDEKFEK